MSKRHPLDYLTVFLAIVSIIVFTVFLTLKAAGVGVVAGWSWWVIPIPIAILIAPFALIAFVAFFIVRPFRWVSRILREKQNLRKMMSDL